MTKRIFWLAQPAMNVAYSLVYGQANGTEVSTSLVIVPCNEAGEMPPELLTGEMKKPTLTKEYNSLLVLAATVPKQEGSMVTSTFKHQAVVDEFNEHIKPVYPFLNESFIRGWVHNHPSGTNPSHADLKTLDEHMRIAPPYHLMVIIDPKFLLGEGIYTRLFINTAIEVPDLTPIPPNEGNVTHVVYENATKYIANPFVDPITIINVDKEDKIFHVGLTPPWWRMAYMAEYNKIIKSKRFNENIALYPPDYGEKNMTLFGDDHYKSKVNRELVKLLPPEKKEHPKEHRTRIYGFSKNIDLYDEAQYENTTI